MSFRLLLMGTGNFALPAFQTLIDSPHETVGLVTQPDRSGRGHHRHPHPLKDLAESRDIPVLQPAHINQPPWPDRLRELQPELTVVAAYGQILSAEVIEIARFGAINLHASLLPKYRGAAPIPYAIKNGESETGVSVFQIQPKLDAGHVLGMLRTPIRAHETAGDLEPRLAAIAAEVCLQVVAQIQAGTATSIPQDASQVSLAPKLTKAAGAINWDQSPARIGCHIRAMQPWPKAFSYWQAADRPPQRLLILETTPVADAAAAAPDAGTQTPAPGTVVVADGRKLVVQTAEGPIEILSLQPEGKRRMDVVDFQCGHQMAVGDLLGPAD
ncbi:MAG: methionyl-tRNA formyltransferase [Planctomycetaceae bacterium]